MAQIGHVQRAHILGDRVASRTNRHALPLVLLALVALPLLGQQPKARATTPMAGGPLAPSWLGDPDLEPGFPVFAQHQASEIGFSGPVHVLLGQLDADPELEIVAPAAGYGALYAWNHDGSPAAGWPRGKYGPFQPALGRFSTTGLPWGLAAVRYHADIGTFPGLVAWRGDGQGLPTAWPFIADAAAVLPPSLGDLDGDGADDIVTRTFGELRAVRADGTGLPGWPVSIADSPHYNMPTAAIADLDRDGRPEVIAIDYGLATEPSLLDAWRHDGTRLAGFPVSFPEAARVESYPVVADVTGDGVPEILLLAFGAFPLAPASVVMVAPDGHVLRQCTVAGSGGFYASAPALADIERDGIPEIIVQTGTHISVVRGDCSSLPGWPRAFSAWAAFSTPVVGDVTGDGLQDIAVTSALNPTVEPSELWLFHGDGRVVAGFPKMLTLGQGGAAAIGDIDGDGRNELLVASSVWANGLLPTVWAYDLHGPAGGRVEWGQFLGGPQRRGVYPVPAQ